MKDALDMFDSRKIKPMRDIIYESLRQAIFEGRFKTGERLVEHELAEKLNVSRTPVREALRKLEIEGLVEHIPRKGVVIKGFKKEDIIEIFTIRGVLEGLAVRYVANNITEAEIKQLEELVELMRKSNSKGDIDKLMNQCKEFNEIIIRASKMPRLIEMINTLQEYTEKTRRVTMASNNRRIDVLKEHEEIFKAIAERDPDRAEKLVKEHLEAAKQSYLKTFAEDGNY